MWEYEWTCDTCRRECECADIEHASPVTVYFTHYSGFQFAFSVLPLIERVQVSLLIGLGLIRQGRADVMLMDAPLEGIVRL